MRPSSVRQRLREGQPAVGTWLSLGNIVAARFLARVGFDWLTVDIEHSLVGIETAVHMFGAIADAGCVPLTRVPSNRHDHIKRVLDNGTHGIVVPMVCTREESEAAISACLYPPRGTRSVGGSLHALNFNTTAGDYFAHANDELLIVLQCEHIEAVRQFDAVYGVGRVDAIFVGPNDLAASMHAADGTPPSPEVFEKTLAEILAGCRRLGVAAGIHCFSVDDARRRINEGWQFIAINSELKFMVDAATQVVKGLGLAQTGELARY